MSGNRVALMGGRVMGERIADIALDTLFREARTHTKWQSRPVTNQTLRDLYKLLKWAPTSANAAPARFVFLRSPEAKARLRPALAPLNVEKTMTAPVTVIIAYDLKFYEQLPKLFPHSPGVEKLFEGNAELVRRDRKTEFELAGRVPDHRCACAGSRLWTDVGFRSGQGRRGVLCRRQTLFRLRSGILPEGHVKSNFLCNLGYGEPSALHPRLPRLPFNEACSIL